MRKSDWIIGHLYIWTPNSLNFESFINTITRHVFIYSIFVHWILKKMTSKSAVCFLFHLSTGNWSSVSYKNHPGAKYQARAKIRFWECVFSWVDWINRDGIWFFNGIIKLLSHGYCRVQDICWSLNTSDTFLTKIFLPRMSYKDIFSWRHFLRFIWKCFFSSAF